MRPKIDTTDAMTFLNWFRANGPWVLVSCKGNDPIEARLCSVTEAPSFLANHTKRGRIVRVLLGEPAPGFRCSKGVPKIERAYYTGLATPIARFKELDAAARPSIWITAKDHAIAVWRLGLPTTGEDAQVAILAFGAEFGGKILPDMIPVPDLGNGFARHSFRFDRDVTVWWNRGKPVLQFSRAPQAKKAEADHGARLKEACAEFGIPIEVTDTQAGPVITLYRVRLGKGIKAEKIASASRDIARVMKCKSARVDDSSDDGTVGIEIPNAKREIVPLQDVLDSPVFKNTKAILPLALGKSIDGSPVVTDLAEMPHLLIAGASGKGKSVEINVIILSLVERFGPDRLNFVMLDPKGGVELFSYATLPHMLAPVVAEPEKSIRALQWVVDEMERRYKALLGVGARNLAAYNTKASTRMPHIVVIVDEVADLMMVAGPAVERAVQRLSQKARAAGIHLIMATHRPSADVIKGAIKANFPARIAFTVSSDTDSRVIIGQNGAERLLGKGDMLYLSGGGDITRVHGAFVSDRDIDARVSSAKKLYGEHRYNGDLLARLEDNDEAAGGTERVATHRDDRLDVYAALTGPMQLCIRFLMTFFQSRLPATADRVLNAAKPLGIREGGTLYRASDMLGIKRQSNGSTKHATWIPPTEWPEGFERVPVAAAE